VKGIKGLSSGLLLSIREKIMHQVVSLFRVLVHLDDCIMVSPSSSEDDSDVEAPPLQNSAGRLSKVVRQNPTLRKLYSPGNTDTPEEPAAKMKRKKRGKGATTSASPPKKKSCTRA